MRSDLEDDTQATYGKVEAQSLATQNVHIEVTVKGAERANMISESLGVPHRDNVCVGEEPIRTSQHVLRLNRAQSDFLCQYGAAVREATPSERTAHSPMGIWINPPFIDWQQRHIPFSGSFSIEARRNTNSSC